MNCINVHKCTEMYSEPDIQNLDNLGPEPERSSLKRRDEKLNADSEATLPRVSRPTEFASRSTDYVELFNTKVNLNVFCTFCLCIFLFCSSKGSENLTFVILSSVVMIICCASVVKMKESAVRTQKCEMSEEVSLSFGPEVVLSDDGVGRSRYEGFYDVHVNYTRENRTHPKHLHEPSRVPLGELSRVFKKSRKFRRPTREQISRNIPKSSKIHCYTRADALNDVNKFCERARIKYRSKRKCCQRRERSENHPLEHTCERKRKTKQKAAKVNKKVKFRLYRRGIPRPGVFRDRNHRINYCKFSLSGDIETNPGPSVVDPTKTIVAPYSQGDITVFGTNAGRQCVAMSLSALVFNYTNFIGLS